MIPNNNKPSWVSSIKLLTNLYLIIVLLININCTQANSSSSSSLQSCSSRGGAIAAGATVTTSSGKQILSRSFTTLRVAVAGGIAGATGTLVLYPLDTAKTLRQSNPEKYRDVRMALQEMVQGHAGKYHNIGMQQAYSGVLSAVLFSIPSSALYFGAYETAKTFLMSKFSDQDKSKLQLRTRLTIHGLAAASGNIASSIIFVPKEYIKQQMQVSKGQLMLMDVVKSTFQTKGITGFYKAYSSTIMRNIPSAILRFALYEELNRAFSSHRHHDNNDNNNDPSLSSSIRIIPLYFLQGALAGAISSGIMTPLDVVKTRIATNTIPNNLSVLQGIQYISKHSGVKNGLYAGAQTRMIWSSAFSAIGFGTFEISKKILGVNNDDA